MTTRNRKSWLITGTSRGFGRAGGPPRPWNGATRSRRASTGALQPGGRFGDTVLPVALDVTDRAGDFAALRSAHTGTSGAWTSW